MRILLLGLTAVLTACVSAPRTPPTPAAADLAFTNVNVVDVESGRVLAEQTVLIAGNRIRAVGPSARVRVAAGTRVVEGRGKYLIPGFWDMHAHVEDTEALSFPLFVAHGVTGIREMGGEGEGWGTWRAGSPSAHVFRPRVVAAGKVIDGPRRGLGGSRITARTAAEGARVVDSLAALGADFIKVYEWLPREAYFGIAEQAKARGLHFAGHVPISVTAEEASASGQRSFEHFGGGWSGMLVYASREETTLRAELLSRAEDPDEEGGNGFARLQRAGWVSRLVETFDPEKMDSLAVLLARNGTYQTPTLAMGRSLNRIPDGSFAASDRVRFVPVQARPYVGTPGGGWWSRFTPTDTAAWTRRDQATVQILQSLHRAGVPILAGTDGGVASVLIPGAGLHEELSALAEAGLSPLESLRAATLNPARYLEATDSLGTVAPGGLADLVLLEANPLEDIRNTQKIAAVVLNGRWLDRTALDGLLAEAERAARGSMPPPGAAVRDSFVVVNGVRLHFRDWGGSGEPVLLLAGLGNSARIYDGFAPELARDFRVLALTRRGHGRSGVPQNGYGLDTLVADIRGFLDVLGIEKAHLVGHSLAGAELTRFAALHPQRVGRLVYLDAAYDRSTQGAVMAADPLERSGPTAEDRASLEAYLAYTRRNRLDLARYWTQPVVADLRENLTVEPDGTVTWKTPGPVFGAIVGGASAAAPEYERVRAPALALYAVEDESYRLPEAASHELRAAFIRFQAEALGAWRRQSIAQFRSGIADGRVVELDAGHHLFLHRPDDVLRLVRDFLRPP